ncbi:MAG: sulfotransferase family protein [Flavobacteriales bacterium]
MKYNQRIYFIVGMGRSGTTLLSNMLNMHPEVVSTPENNFALFGKSLAKSRLLNIDFELFKEMIKRRHNHETSIWFPSDSFIDAISREDVSYSQLCKAVYLNYDKAKNPEEASVLVDKNPIYSLYMDKILKLFPEARFIVLSRDYRDNILSRKRVFTGWINSNTIHSYMWAKYYKSIMAFANKHKGITHFFRYEDLVSHPESELKRLCDFLQVEYCQDMTNPAENTAKLLSHAEVNLGLESRKKIELMHNRLLKPIDTEKLNKWQGKFNQSELNTIEVIAGKTGEYFNYKKTLKPSIGDVLLVRLKLFLLFLPINSYNFIFDLYYYKMPLRLKLFYFKKR